MKDTSSFVYYIFVGLNVCDSRVSEAERLMLGGG